MSKIVHEITKEDAQKSIETMKVRKETLEYLRQNGFKTIDDFVKRQDEVPGEFRGNVYAYLMFGVESD